MTLSHVGNDTTGREDEEKSKGSTRRHGDGTWLGNRGHSGHLSARATGSLASSATTSLPPDLRSLTGECHQAEGLQFGLMTRPASVTFYSLKSSLPWPVPLLLGVASYLAWLPLSAFCLSPRVCPLD